MRYLSSGAGGGFEIVGSSGVMLMLLCLMIMFISNISILLFRTVDCYSNDRSNNSGNGARYSG